jgi:hypothetical protein
MTKTSAPRSGSSTETLLHSLEEGREEAAHAWSRACMLCSHYFAALAKAETPPAIMQANVELFSKSMEAMGKSVSVFQHIAASTTSTKH